MIRNKRQSLPLINDNPNYKEEIMKYKKCLVVTHILLVGYFIQCSKPVPTEELVKAREEIEIANTKKIEGESEEYLNKAIEALKSAHSQLPEENYEESKKLANQSFIYSKLSQSISLPSHIEKQKEAYDKKINEAYEANAEILAKADYESAKSLYEQAEQENKLKDLAITEEEKNQLSTQNYKSENEKKQIEEKLQLFVLNANAVESNLQKALSAANIAYETSIAHKEEYFSQLASIQNKYNEAKKYKIEQYEPEKSSLIQKEINDTKDLIRKNQLRIAHENIERLNRNVEELISIAVAKYSEEIFKKAEESLTNTKDKISKSQVAIKDTERNKNISETLLASEEAYKQAKANLENKDYESSIKNSEEVIRLTKILNDMIDSSNLAYKNLQMVLEEQKKKEEQKIEPVKEEKLNEITSTTEEKEEEIKTFHTVQKNEYLWKISGYKHIYNNPRKWKRIYEANKDQIKNPNLIYPNQKLKILKESNN